MNTREGWAQGWAVTAARHVLSKYMLVGIRGLMNTDYRGVTEMEAGAFLRAYPFKLGLGGAFAQVGFGISSFSEEDRRRLTLLLDYSVGFRFFFLGGFYTEAYVRSGYPFRFGGGLVVGHRFNF